MWNLKFIGFTTVCFLLALNSFSQDLYETGSIYPTEETKGILPIKTITQDEIRMLNASTVMDVITYLLSFETIYIGRKGYDVRFNAWGKNNIKILINSRPVVPDALDKFSYTQLPVYNIDHIEILEGSYPVLYASNAVSVIVNIVLKKNTKSFMTADAGMRYSSKGTADVFGMVDFKLAKHRIGIGLNRNFFAGYDPISSKRSSQWKPVRLYNFSAEYDYSIIHGFEFYTSIFSTNEVVLDYGQPIQSTNRVFDNELLTRHNVLNGGLKGKLSKYHYLLFDNSYTSISQQNTVYTRLLDKGLEESNSSAPGDSISYDQYKIQFILAREVHRKYGYQIGMEFNHQRDRNLLIQDAVKTKITNMAFNSRITFEPSSNFSVNGGLRYNESSKYSTPLSYEGSFKYYLTNEFSIRGNYSRSFRTPTFNELYYVFEDESLNIKGNLNLESETYEGFLGSINIQSGDVNVNASGYYQKTENGISFRQIDSVQKEYSFVNVQTIQTIGSKLYVTVNKKDLRINSGVNIITINPVELGNQFTPLVEMVGRVTYTHPSTNAQIWVFSKYRSKKVENVNSGDRFEEISTEAFWLLDAGFSIPLLGQKITLSTGMKNILDVYTVEGLHLPLIRLNDDEINKKVPVVFDIGRRFWFSLNYQI